MVSGDSLLFSMVDIFSLLAFSLKVAPLPSVCLYFPGYKFRPWGFLPFPWRFSTGWRCCLPWWRGHSCIMQLVPLMCCQRSKYFLWTPNPMLSLVPVWWINSVYQLGCCPRQCVPPDGRFSIVHAGWLAIQWNVHGIWSKYFPLTYWPYRCGSSIVIVPSLRRGCVLSGRAEPWWW